MNSFAYIASHFFPETDILKVAFAFPENRSSVINTDFISYGFLNSLHFGKSKFLVLESSVLTNMYIDKDRRESMLEVFSKTQRTYRGFARLALLYKVRHSKTYNVDTDLCFNSLTALSEKIITNIYDDASRTIYKFRISDIINITKSALSNAPSFFTEPLSIKNPYTNLPFSISQLYHLYFVVKESPYIMPSLFHHFFELNFDLDEFADRHEALIRDESIKIFLITSTCDQKYFHIVKMITLYDEHFININIHPNFPVEKLVEGLSPFLKDYLYGVYSLNPSLRFHARRHLRTSLIRFAKLNPSYGRKVFRRNRFMNTSVDISGAEFNIYSPSNSYHSDPRPGRENLSFRFVDDIVTEPLILTPRQLARSRRMRQERRQPVSPLRRSIMRRIGPSRNATTRQGLVAARTRYSPQDYHVSEEADAVSGNTETPDNTQSSDNTETPDNSDDDESSVLQDIPEDNSISMRYDGAESLDHESEDHTDNNLVIGGTTDIGEDDTASFDSTDQDSSSSSASEPPDWPSSLVPLPNTYAEQRTSLHIEDEYIRHTHEDIDAIEDIVPDIGDNSEHTRELVNATISDILGDFDSVTGDILGNIAVPQALISSATHGGLVSHTPLLPSQIPVPPLQIPERTASSWSFPEPPPPPPPMPTPVFPLPLRGFSAIPLEFESSSEPTMVTSSSSDDD
jgi:hypothetical protein